MTRIVSMDLQHSTNPTAGKPQYTIKRFSLLDSLIEHYRNEINSIIICATAAVKKTTTPQ